MLLQLCACVDMVLVQAKDSGADRKKREKRQRQKEGFLLSIQPSHVALAARRHCTLTNLSLQLPKLMTLHITANGSWI